MTKPRLSSRVFSACLGLALLLAGPAPAQETTEPEPEAPSPLALEGIEVDPAAPGPGTLVQLRARVVNRGQRPASQLGFQVTIDGDPLPVYRNQIFMQALPPGETSVVRLYNFWTTETFRPMPKDGKLNLEVTLQEAHWYRIEDVEEEGETIEEWSPLEPVPGLPSSRSLVLDLKKGDPGPYADLEGGNTAGQDREGKSETEEPSPPVEGAEEGQPDGR